MVMKKNIANASVFWDIENCHVPKNKKVSDIKQAIYKLANEYDIIINNISAIGSSKIFRTDLEDELKDEGILFENMNEHKANGADMKLLYKIMAMILKTPPPYTIILISGDSDFLPLIKILKEHEYSTILIHTIKAKSELITAANISLTWNKLLDVKPFGNDPFRNDPFGNDPFGNDPVLKYLNTHNSEEIYSDWIYDEFDYYELNRKLNISSFNLNNVCVIELYTSGVYGVYNIPELVKLGIGDIVEVEDYVCPTKTWTMGKVVKIFQSKRKSIFNVINVVTSSTFSTFLNNKKIKDKSIFCLCKTYESRILFGLINIVDAEMRWDELNITVRFAKLTNQYVDFKPFMRLLRNTHNKYINMVQVIVCADGKHHCDKKFCKYYHFS